MANKVVTRDELAKKLQGWVYNQTEENLPMTAAREEVSWLFETLSEALTKGDEVRIHGFGTFRTTQRAARMGRNPRTGEAVKVAARRVVRFSPSTTLSAQLKSGKATPAKKAKR